MIFYGFSVINNSVYNIGYLKFVFNDLDYEKIITYLEDLKIQKKAISLHIKLHLSNRNVFLSEIEDTIQLLEKGKNEFNQHRDENSIYIEIPDFKDFFYLIVVLNIKTD